MFYVREGKKGVVSYLALQLFHDCQHSEISPEIIDTVILSDKI